MAIGSDMIDEQFHIHWIDKGTPPKIEPNPAFPDGVPEIDITRGEQPNCVVMLPYPTGHRNTGLWIVRCRLCQLRAVITAASRPDDPRSARLPCKLARQ